jgi:uncharacterized membrane protein YhaH (DUF805 family)
MNWYLEVLKKYAEFSGRARRKEYWMFTLFNSIFLIVAIILDNMLGTAIEDVGYGLIYFLYALAVLVPGLAVSVRRLHDVGKSGWMILISLIPIIGAIWLLVLMVTDSNPGENEYGPNPKGNNYSGSATDSSQPSLAVNNSSKGDTIILIIVIWMFVVRMYWSIIPKWMPEYYSTEWFKITNGISGFIWAFIPLGLAFAVKNKSMQFALFILGGLYLVYGLYETMMQFII